jgi:hypothetical protein
MGLQIEDGKGRGYSVEVTSDNKLVVSARTMTRGAYVMRDNGQTYSWQNLTYDYAAAETILLVKNTSTMTLYIDRIRCSGDTATEVVIHSPVCDTPTGTAVTGVNLNRMSGNVAGAIAKANESTNSIANAITRQLVTANTTILFEYEGMIALGQNNCIAVDFVANGGSAFVTIIGWFE